MPMYEIFFPYLGCVDSEGPPTYFEFYIPKYSRELKLLVTLFEIISEYYVNWTDGQRFQYIDFNTIQQPVTIKLRGRNGL